jgi:hypothetical protein
MFYLSLIALLAQHAFRPVARATFFYSSRAVNEGKVFINAIPLADQLAPQCSRSNSNEAIRSVSPTRRSSTTESTGETETWDIPT